MDIQATFQNICNCLGLGPLLEQVKRVHGGYMHKMYCIKAEKGSFAVKMLNPVIMKRPDVFENFKLAESLEEKLQANNIPVVPALEINGVKMQCINEQYLYIFDWLNGKTLRSAEIKKEHCKLIGGILAQIHRIEQKEKPYIHNSTAIDWDFYISLSFKKCPEIATLLHEARELLYCSQKEANCALKKVPNVFCICNGDMDSKNILWIDHKPNIIDLECLNYGNPYMELFELALCWSGYEDCNVNYDLLKSFIKSYIDEYGEFEVDWTVLYHANIGRLKWLEYNVKRALMIECENEEERNLGIEQVKETISHVIYYNEIRKPLLKQLNNLYS